MVSRHRWLFRKPKHFELSLLITHLNFLWLKFIWLLIIPLSFASQNLLIFYGDRNDLLTIQKAFPLLVGRDGLLIGILNLSELSIQLYFANIDTTIIINYFRVLFEAWECLLSSTGVDLHL